MRAVKPLLIIAAAGAIGLLGGCRSGSGSAVPGSPPTDNSVVSSTLVAAQAEIANNTTETATPRDTTTVAAREDNPETMQPVVVTFPTQ